MRKIAIAGEIYSPNLGDGIIHQSLVYLYHKIIPSLPITPVDISGRIGWNNAPRQSLTANLSRIGRQSFPSFYRWLNVLRLGTKYLLFEKKHWLDLLTNAHVLVIGGGQLLMDNELDFPFKLYLLASTARELKIPYYLQAVGAGSRWSRTGKKWMQMLIQNAAGISVRDEVSKQHVYNLFPREDIRLAADAAVWANEVYGKPAPHRSGWIGVGLLNRVDFNTHRMKEETLSMKQYLAFWQKLGNEFLRRGCRVEYFTNGNWLDESLAVRLAQCEYQPKGALKIAKRPAIPSELAERVSSYQAVFAARLHANLLAGVYGIPALGLNWDAKVGQFYRMMGCEERVINFHQDAPREIVDRLLSLSSGIPHEKIDAGKALVWEDVDFVCRHTGLT